MNEPDPAERLFSSAEAMGVEVDEAEAARWIDAMSAEGSAVTVDIGHGVYGHRVAMADLDAGGLDRFRRMAAIVGFEDRPPEVLTALALSGSAAQARVQRFPADADFFERIHLSAPTREAACRLLAEVMRDKALSTRSGAGHRLTEVRFGSWPVDAELDGLSLRRGSSVAWTPAQVEAGGIAYRTPGGEEGVLWWDDAALQPGWCKLDWVIEDPTDRSLSNVSNMLDVTWEAPDGTIAPLDGFLDAYFQEVYLETDSIPLFSRLVKQLGADAVADYVTALNGEIRSYTVDHPNYGKAARRLYNVFRLTGMYAEAAYLRELFDEPVTALYQVAAILRTLDEAAAVEDRAFDAGTIVAEFDGLIMSAVGALEGRAEEEMVRRLLALREAFAAKELRDDVAAADDAAAEAATDGTAGADPLATREASLKGLRADAMVAVDDWFRRMLEAVPSIKAYLEGLATAPEAAASGD